jgi:thioesterase domain-containing protein
MIFQDLCKNLGDDQPFYGLQAQGLDGESDPLTSIKAMSAQCLSEIRQVPPQGPYIFGGMCLGGLIAYEMAQQIQISGDEVALVVLLDARNPSSMLAMDENDITNNNTLNKIKNKLKQGDLLNTLKRKTGRFATKVIKNTTWAIKEKVGNQFIDQEKRFYKHIWDANAIARKAYIPKPYTGDILALLAAEAPDGSPRDPKRGWTKLAPQLEVIKVPGRHDTVVREPQVKGLAQSINQRLAQIANNT